MDGWTASTSMIKIVNHSKRVLQIAYEQGWHIGARYTNLRDIKSFTNITFIDIDWKNYSFEKHFDAVSLIKPKLTVANDVVNLSDLETVLNQAEILHQYCENVIIVPKAPELEKNMNLIPEKFILGYSVPTKYGKTEIPIKSFGSRRVHLLGGRPEIQRNLANHLNVFSVDCNRFTLDAQFGDFFLGCKFIPHHSGGYENCIRDSIININKLWEDYHDD